MRAEDNELLARQAGATTVINPVSFAGLLLAGSAHGPNIADYIADLASTHGRVQLSEREVTAGGMWQAAVRNRDRARRADLSRRQADRLSGSRTAGSLCAGDRIIEIVPSVNAEADLPLEPGLTNYTTPQPER